MKPVNARRYHSPLRQEQAAVTRARILEAASDLFVAKGYGSTSIREIAQAATVAADTVYTIFGTKAQLLTALIDIRLVPSGTSVLERAEIQRLSNETDPRVFLRLFARDYAAMRARVGPIREVLRTAKAVDSQMGAVLDDIERHRFNYMHTIVRWLAQHNDLGVPTRRAAQILWALASPEVGRMLCDVQGWTTHAYAEWLENTLAETLLR